MNVGVPGEGDTSAFYAVIGVMIVILVGMLAWFRRRGWL
jgi:magnesium transporter